MDSSADDAVITIVFNSVLGGMFVRGWLRVVTHPSGSSRSETHLLGDFLVLSLWAVEFTSVKISTIFIVTSDYSCCNSNLKNARARDSWCDRKMLVLSDLPYQPN